MARPRHRSGNLPAETTSFVGRRRELAEIRQKLAAARLVSLVGPGGVGKTRLALRAADDLSRGFSDGAWLVELAEVRDAALVPSAVLAAVDLRDQAGVEPLQILRSFWRNKALLLVFDNCEHVLDAAAQLIAEALRSAPNIRVIATSREPLQVAGEHVVPVTPLQLPRDDGTEPLAHVRENEAVVLFTERAAAASGTFVLTDVNQAAVVAVCRRLDGLPLAIELAAVRTRVLSVEQILERLRDRFALLTGGSRAALPRHQTLRMTIDWSYDLLTARERHVLRRLSVFATRFTLDDVESVCTDGELAATDTLDLLSSLVEKSLLMKEDFGGRDCYRLHETMREYATLKLRDEHEDGELSERCVDYYWKTCLSTEAEGRYQLRDWLAWVELEIDNIRAVLQHCVSHRELRPRARCSGLVAVLLDHPRNHGEHSLAGSPVCIRGGVSAHAGARSRPSWLAECGAGRHCSRQAMARSRHRNGSGNPAAGGTGAGTLGRRQRGEPDRQSHRCRRPSG